MDSFDYIRLIENLVYKWRRALAPCGTHYLGNTGMEYMLPIITYKRICDCMKEKMIAGEYADEELLDEWDIYKEAFDDGLLPFEIRKISRWEYVITQKNKARALCNAIDVINELNFCNIPYGDKLIPSFYCSEANAKTLNPIFNEWLEELSNVDFGKHSLDADSWQKIAKMMRKTRR